MPSTWFRRRTLVLGASLAIMVLASSPAAMATTARTESPAVPDTAQFITYIPDNVIAYACTIGLQSNYPLTPVLGYNNECNERVWFHQYQYNGSGYPPGWTLCISPSTYVPSGDLEAQFQNPGNIMVSGNTSPCP
jgi:hypothetical protein